VKVITANLNGFRSAARKGLWAYLAKEDPDFLCCQELKAQESNLEEVDKNPLGMHRIWHCAEKRGYSGVALYSKQPPQHVQIGLSLPQFNVEGRYICADFKKFSLVCLYLPSGTSSNDRQQVKFQFLNYFSTVLSELRACGREVLICGDWNIAHTPLDLKNWRSNQKHSGFLPEERAWLTEVLEAGWVDVWRQLYPDIPGYTWWSNRGQAYAKDVGWRIDYQIASPKLAKSAKNAFVYKEEKFSDHAPLVVNYAW
jgi:exodeoxyribonuclease III